MKLITYCKLITSLCLSKLHFICFMLIGMLFLSCKETISYENISIPAPVAFSSNIPVDVDPALQKKLKDSDDIYALNTSYNLYSWQALIAINWPLDTEGKALPNFTDDGTPTWLQWKEAFQVFRKDGRKPAPWGSERTDSGLALQTNLLRNKGARIILSNRTPTDTGLNNIADETDQAFTGKLFDQNGEVVVYEVLINKEEFDYLVTNKLYNKNGQIAFTKNNPNKVANFPKGDYEKGALGATEIKLAWRILKDTDLHKDRYFRDEGYLKNDVTGKMETTPVDLGLIGFHISQKTPTGKQWVWSTFEHIDNLDQNVIEVNGKTTVIHPTLTDPNCEICPVNIDATHGDSKHKYMKSKHSNYWKISSDSANYYADATAIMKTQSKRMVDIPVRVQRINKMMQDYFKQQGSVWQYYQLIDTQYPIDQNSMPAISTDTVYNIPKSVDNKPGGKPNLTFLTNITMETFFQQGNQIAGLMENSDSASDGELPITIFGTESCMGCHSSAPIFNSYTVLKDIKKKDSIVMHQGTQLSGDFSWLLKRAAWNKDLPKPTSKK